MRIRFGWRETLYQNQLLTIIVCRMLYNFIKLSKSKIFENSSKFDQNFVSTGFPENLYVLSDKNKRKVEEIVNKSDKFIYLIMF